jgi:hypothetical protein
MPAVEAFQRHVDVRLPANIAGGLALSCYFQEPRAQETKPDPLIRLI